MSYVLWDSVVNYMCICIYAHTLLIYIHNILSFLSEKCY